MSVWRAPIEVHYVVSDSQAKNRLPNRCCLLLWVTSIWVQSMEKIQHRHVDIQGLKLHVAEIGSGPDVLLLHGFPEIWYSWRHQMIALADEGFHAIAPDFRGYGLSDQPPEIKKAGFVDLVEDLIGLLDAFSIQKVFVVGKDFGAMVAYFLDLLYPDRVRGMVIMGTPYRRPGPEYFAMDKLPPGFYIRRWQEPGRALADFGRFNTEAVVRNIYTLFSRSELPVAEEGQEIMDLYDSAAPLPYWFTEDDLKAYSSLYEKSGFAFPMQVPYMAMKSNWGKLGEITDYTIQAPTLWIVGTEDYSLRFPGRERYSSGQSQMPNTDVPNMEIKLFPEGSHFVQEQFPEEINKLTIDFLNKHLQS